MSSGGRASQACRQCRRLKRKCTRELPSCSLCDRLSKSCEYPQRASRSENASNASNASNTNAGLGGGLPAGARRPEEEEEEEEEEGIGSPSGQANVAGDLIPGGSALANFPTSYFLDPDFLVPLPCDALSSARLPLAAQCLQFCGTDLVAICHAYVGTVGHWLPILSPKRLLQDINARDPDDSGLILLLSSLRLLSDAAYVGPCREYELAKALSSSAENKGVVSLRLLQSLVLLATYELGHGIYPSSFFTIGRAARLAMVIGPHDRKAAPQLFKIADTFTLQEEERRTWWAVFILDRFCNIVTEGLPFAIQEPTKNFLLPISDMGWSKGSLGDDTSSSLVSSFTSEPGRIGRFATMCQASHLLGHVIKHRNLSKAGDLDGTFQLNEALQLHRTLVALDGRIPVGESLENQDHPETESNIEALALVCSARLILYNIYGCSEPDVRSEPDRLQLEIEMQRLSIKGVVDLATNRVPKVAQLAIEIFNSSSESKSSAGKAISPTLGHCLYHAATECAWFIREGCGPDMTAGLKVCLSALKQLQTSWAVSTQYLSLLAKDNTISQMSS